MSLGMGGKHCSSVCVCERERERERERMGGRGGGGGAAADRFKDRKCETDTQGKCETE